MESQPKRHAGFIVGSTRKGEIDYWTVRVKDDSSEFNGRKFEVLSVHDSVQLGRGLNITFLVGSVDSREQERILKAVDVRIV